MRPSANSWSVIKNQQPLRLGDELFLLGLKDRSETRLVATESANTPPGLSLSTLGSR